MPEADADDHAPRRVLADLSRDLWTVGEWKVDPELHVAVDALLLSLRLEKGQWRVVAAMVWLAYRVGCVVGRRQRVKRG